MRTYLLFICSLLLYACQSKFEPELIFEEAQPNTAKDLSAFRKDFQGEYFNPNDSSGLIIENRTITKRKKIEYLFHRSEIDSGFVADIHDNHALTERFSKMGAKISIRGDSIFANWTSKDTLFTISSNQVLRQLKGYYFLNIRVEGGWTVLRLDLQKKKLLQFSRINPLDSLEKFQPTTNIHKILDDTGAVVGYTIKPSKRELKKLMKEQAFIPTDDFYIRIKK